MIEEYPLDEECVRIVSIDPSTSHAGLAFMDVNIVKPAKFKLIYANTIHGDKVSESAELNYQDYGLVQSRMRGVSKSYRALLEVFDPTVAICENNFLGPSPDTFKRLVEAVSLLRMETQLYGHGLYMTFVAPKAAKEIVGANFIGTKKEDVLIGLEKYKRLDRNNIDIHKLDNNGVDAIVIGLYMAEKIIKDRGVGNEY